jgi:hypothetical protein
MTEQTRSFLDRRSGTDRRKAYRTSFLSKGGTQKGKAKERRSREERREGWVRVDKWSSVQLDGLKIAKFLKQANLKTTFKTGS